MIVADANLAVYLVLPGALTSQAEQARAKDKQWVAPPLFRSEVLNVPATYVRSGRLTRDEALTFFRRSEAVVKIDTPTSRDADVDILNLAIQGNCSAYDAEYVALAQRLNIVAVTSDQDLARAFPNRVVLIAEYIRSAK